MLTGHESLVVLAKKVQVVARVVRVAFVKQMARCARELLAGLAVAFLGDFERLRRVKHRLGNRA